MIEEVGQWLLEFTCLSHSMWMDRIKKVTRVYLSVLLNVDGQNKQQLLEFTCLSYSMWMDRINNGY